MKKKRISVILVTIILCIYSLECTASAKDTPEELKGLYAQSAVLMDADSGRILFGKNDSDIMPMASTTKIMTCILALENIKCNQIGVVSANAAKQPKVHLGVNTGEKYYIRDLLYSLMLESHNDSAVIIAESIGGTVEQFAAMMNEKAKDIGCTSTYFITPNGLDDEDKNGIHSTTAADLALIMRYCIRESPQKEQFINITREREYQFSDVAGKRIFVCYNHNSFLDMMSGALSGKTGFTNNAGYCYVGALHQGEKMFIVALLACGWPGNKGYKWADTKKLMEYALDNYDYKIVEAQEESGEIKVINALDEHHPFVQQNVVEIKTTSTQDEVKILMSKDEKINKKIVKSNSVEAPVEKGEKVGTIYYSLNDRILMSTDIITVNGVEIRNIKSIWRAITDVYFWKSKNK